MVRATGVVATVGMTAMFSLVAARPVAADPDSIATALA
jgi:hypothetical protein